jgi:hypothetical protein
MVSIAVSVSVKQALNKSILDFSAPATEKPCGSAASLRDDRPAQPGSHSFSDGSQDQQLTAADPGSASLHCGKR